MTIALIILLAVPPVVAVMAAVRDLTTMTIPNWMSLVLIAGFFPAAWLVGLAPMAVLAHVGVAVAALVVGAGMFALRWIGGGDAKLLAASCLWMGLGGTLPFLMLTGVAGGVFCLALLGARAHP